jgi:hypothetical protein
LGFREAEKVGAKTLPFNMQPWLSCMQDMKVVKHRVRGDNGIELRLSEIGGEGRSAWVSEGSVSKALREEYFNRAGQARQKQRKKSRLQPLPAEAEDEGSLPTLPWLCLADLKNSFLEFFLCHFYCVLFPLVCCF